MSPLTKPPPCQKPGATATNTDEGQASLDHFWSLQNKKQDDSYLAQNSVHIQIHGGENESQKSVFGDKSNSTRNTDNKELE